MAAPDDVRGAGVDRGPAVTAGSGRMAFVRLVDYFGQESAYAAGQAAWHTHRATQMANGLSSFEITQEQRASILEISGRASAWMAVARAYATAADMVKRALGPLPAETPNMGIFKGSHVCMTYEVEKPGGPMRCSVCGEVEHVEPKAPTTCDFFVPDERDNPLNRSLRDQGIVPGQTCGEVIRWSQANGWTHESDLALGESSHRATPPAGYGR